METKSVIIIMLAAITVAGCKNKKNLPENYRDDMFVAMLNDSTCMVEEYRIQNNDSLPYTVAFYANLEQPILWEEDGDTILRIMADWYNCCAINNAIETDVDTWVRYEEDDEELVENILDNWSNITLVGIKDTFSLRRMKECIEANINKTGDTTVRNISDVYDRLTTWMSNINPEDYEEKIAPNICPQHFLPEIWKGRYNDYVGKDAHPDSLMRDTLYKVYYTTTQYDARLAMLFMLMYAYYYDNNDTTTNLLRHAEEAFTSGNYSPMLPLVWRAYRVLFCSIYSCPSTYCDIPNVRFNYYRRLIGYTYLRHLELYPDDTDAKVQFYFLAYRENINRFGEYIMGNQSSAEYISIFWNGSTI